MPRKVTRREDYLKTIDALSRTGEVRGVTLAAELGVSKPTVCIYLKQLAEAGDIIMDEHHTVHLTAQGREVAESTQEKHSLLFSLLHSLGVPEQIAAEDACAIEHNLSDASFEALKQLLRERMNKKSEQEG